MTEEKNEINFSEPTGDEKSTATKEPQDEDFQEVVEVQWEDLEELLRARQGFSDNQSLLTDMFLTYEKRKQNLLSNLAQLEVQMNDIARGLQEKHDLNLAWTYELKLPTQLGEKGYFIRKQEES
tara:strand:+ start:196 stop:567 length:372 start_codon:yes stop_codon:yes gene_type:complete